MRRAGMAALGLVLAWLVAAGALAADDQLIPLEVKVVAASDGQPIWNASVYVRFKESRWFILKDKKRDWHTKTNREGVARLPGIPPGKVLIQVVAEGWKTFGQFYDIGEEPAEMPELNRDRSSRKVEVVEIKLERPRRWY